MTKHPLRIVLFTVMDFALELMGAVAHTRGDEIAAIVTCPGPVSRRSDAYLGVVAKAPPNVDVLVSNHKQRYAAMVEPYAIDALVCMGYPWLLPADLLNVPPLGAINFHNSLLPQYRGPNAFGWAIVNGETSIGMTAHRMDPEFDTGPILQQRSFPFGINDTIDTLSQQMGPAMFGLINDALDQVVAGDPGRPQVGEGSYAPKFEESFRVLDFSETALSLHNKVRAYIGGRDLPKGALATIEGKELCITETFYDPEMAKIYLATAPGTVLQQDEAHIIMQCGDIPLEIRSWHAVTG